MMYWALAMAVFLMLIPACVSTVSSMQHPRTGLAGNRLHPCPSSPNCVCSEFPDHDSSIPPVPYDITPEAAWALAVSTVVEKMGGKTVTQDNGYFHATFTSRIFRFVDDLELRLDREKSVIQLRSASRTGYFDFGVNRKRTEQFQTFFLNAQ